MRSLEDVQARCEDIQKAIASMDEGLAKMRDSLSVNQQWIAVAESGSEIEYDLEALKKECVHIENNIKVVEGVRLLEQQKLVTVSTDLAAGLQILKAHGKCPSLMFRGEHDWEIVETFGMDYPKHNGEWKTRRCKQCSTEERLGHG